MVVSFKVLFSNVRFATFTTYLCNHNQPHIMDIKRVPVSIYAEMTPNPKVMKFVSNKMLLQTDSAEFRNIEEAKPSPLATKLFHFPFVKEVFISGNYIAIAKFDVIEWDDVAQEVRVFITDFLQEGGVAVHEGQLKPAETVETEADGSPAVRDEDLGEIEGRIVDILEEYIKPAVAQDGGNIAFMGYKDKIVEVQLQGACSGCPSSTMTLKNGILSILQKMLPTLVDDVVAVNG
jgi:Fe-S cluster biogenesis protein NfuA